MASLLTDASQDSSGDVLGRIFAALHAAVCSGVAAAGGSHPEPVIPTALLYLEALMASTRYSQEILGHSCHCHASLVKGVPYCCGMDA